MEQLKDVAKDDKSQLNKLPVELLGMTVGFMEPRYEFIDLEENEYIRQNNDYYNYIDPTNAQYPHGYVGSVGVGSYQINLNGHSVTVTDSKNWVSLFVVIIDENKYMVKVKYYWYRIAEIHYSYVSILDDLLEDIEKGRNSRIQNSIFLYDAKNKELRTMDSSFQAKGKMLEKVIEWLKHIKNRVPPGYILVTR